MMRGSNMGILPYWLIMCGYMGVSAHKAASGLPLDSAYQSFLQYHLGAWSYPNHSYTS